MSNKAATDNITGAVVVGSKNKFKVRIKQVKSSIIGLSIIGVIFILIGSLVLAYFTKEWDTKKWVSIIGIVFLLIGFLCLATVGIMIIIVVKIFNSLNSIPFHPLEPDHYKNVKYPRQIND